MVHSYRSSKLCLQEADSNLGLLPCPVIDSKPPGKVRLLAPARCWVTRDLLTDRVPVAKQGSGPCL